MPWESPTPIFFLSYLREDFFMKTIDFWMFIKLILFSFMIKFSRLNVCTMITFITGFTECLISSEHKI